MGTLVAKAYPTSLFANLADHTYVECLGGGKAWSCWGGKSGGRNIGQGVASTKRADCIAKPNERAGIRCYLVNGVCHQAANRILIEARITVRRARGYSISSALFGTYGRQLAWPCAAHFDQCSNVTGDLPPCAEPAVPESLQERLEPEGANVREATYLEEVLGMYAAAGAPDKAAEDREARLQVDLFLHFARYQMDRRFEEVEGALEEIRSDTEEEIQDLQARFGEGVVTPREYVTHFDKITMAFQDAMARSLPAPDYRALFALQPDERVSLIDPRIVQAVYGV